MRTGRKFLGLAIIFIQSISAFSQNHLPPVALNDTAIVTSTANDTLPRADTINLTANDYSPSGDSLCVTAVYGSSYFRILNCHDVIFNSSTFGVDSAWYVVCNDSQPNLCDTGEVVVTVARHNMGIQFFAVEATFPLQLWSHI